MKERVAEILKSAGGKGVECEVYGESTRGLTIEVYKGKVESLEYYDDCGVGIRLFRDRRVGFAFTSDTSTDSLQEAFSRAYSALSAASSLDVDPLAEPGPGGRDGIPAGLYGELPSDFDLSVKMEGALLMEQACYGRDPAVVNTEGVVYDEAVADIFVVGTRLELVEERRGYCSASLSAVASRNGDVKSAWFHTQAQSPKAVDFENVGIQAAERAVGLLGARQMKTGRYPVFMDETAFAAILRFVGSIFSGERVAKGSSVLSRKLNEKVASSIVTLVDDPFLPGGCFNAGFDAEGLRTAKNVLIDCGVLRSFLNNAYSARMLSTEPTANAVRSSYRSQPVPGASNLYLTKGSRSKREILLSIGEGLYVTDIMGIHTADVISGDFSFGILGYYVKDGEVRYPVSEVTISGNILGLLGGIVELSDELTFIGSYGAPAVLVEGLSVGGD